MTKLNKTNLMEHMTPNLGAEIAQLVRGCPTPVKLAEKLAAYREADLALALPLLGREEQRRLCCALPAGRLAALLPMAENGEACFRLLGDGRKLEVLCRMRLGAAAELLRRQPDGARLLQQLPHEQGRLLLELADPKTRWQAGQLAHFGPDEIGSHLSANFIAVPRTATIKEAMSQLVRQAADHDNIAALFLVDKNGLFCGAVDLKDLIVAREGTPLRAIADEAYPYLYATAGVEECLPFLAECTADSVPVLDERGRLLGVITTRDFAQLLDRELGDDYAKLAGLAGEEDLAEPVTTSVKKRMPWLCVLLVLGLGVSAAVGVFESVVAQLPLIMCFQSLILDMAGNVGTQSLAVAIRVLMDGRAAPGQKAALVWKEARVGLANGGLLGQLSFIVIGAYLWLGGSAPAFAFGVAGCLGAAMVLAMAVSALSGTVVPIFFQRMGIDPAVASGPLITTLNDLVAVVAYYGLAWLVLLQWMRLA